MAKRKSGKQRQAIRRKSEAAAAAVMAARPRVAPPPCDYCGKRHEGNCPGPWCPVCNAPLPPVLTGRQVTCGRDWCRDERQRRITRERVARWRAGRRERARAPAGDQIEFAFPD